MDITIQMLACLEQLHSLGIIHGKVRFKCFVVGKKSKTKFYIINFSHSRLTKLSKTDPKKPSKILHQSFDRYAPRAQHNGLGYHRRNDFESWFYISCDFFHFGFLPWSVETRLKSQQMLEFKEKLLKGDSELFFNPDFM